MKKQAWFKQIKRNAQKRRRIERRTWESIRKIPMNSPTGGLLTVTLKEEGESVS